MSRAPPPMIESDVQIIVRVLIRIVLRPRVTHIQNVAQTLPHTNFAAPCPCPCPCPASRRSSRASRCGCRPCCCSATCLGRQVVSKVAGLVGGGLQNGGGSRVHVRWYKGVRSSG
jgi:hypothetical protein